MTGIPIVPHLDRYRGRKEELRRKVLNYNSTAQRIADYVNTLIANYPNEIQLYIFDTIATDLGVSVEHVRKAISTGGHNGITIKVAAEDRYKLARFKTSCDAPSARDPYRTL